MVEILSAAFDLGGKKLGSRLGPSAMRMCSLSEVIEELGYDVRDRGDVVLEQVAVSLEGLRGFSALLPLLLRLRANVEEILSQANLPLVLCGEHTLAAGGISAAINTYGNDLAVLWIDAHADIHTPSTSATGNLHGMPIAALEGLTDESIGTVGDQWNILLERLGPKRLSPEQVGWFGLRDVDIPERPRLSQSFAATMHEIDRFGIETTLDRFHDRLIQFGRRKLWISFDIDVLDPFLAPGTGTAVRGGLTYREAHLMAELLRERLEAPGCPYTLAGVDIVEVNPLADVNNQTAAMATEWLASLLGKTIL